MSETDRQKWIREGVADAKAEQADRRSTKDEAPPIPGDPPDPTVKPIDMAPASPSAHHRKLAEALIEAWNSERILDMEAVDLFAAVLAAEQVVDWETYTKVTDSLHDKIELLDQAEQQLAALRQTLGNLMAVINRDGGDWAARFATDEEATADAQDKVVGIFANIESHREQLAALRLCEGNLNREVKSLRKQLDDLRSTGESDAK